MDHTPPFGKIELRGLLFTVRSPLKTSTEYFLFYPYCYDNFAAELKVIKQSSL